MRVPVEDLTDTVQFAGATVVLDYGDDAFIRDRLVTARRSGDVINLRFVYVPMIPVEVGTTVLVFWPDQPWRELGVTEEVFDTLYRFDIDPKVVEDLRTAGFKIVEKED